MSLLNFLGKMFGSGDVESEMETKAVTEDKSLLSADEFTKNLEDFVGYISRKLVDYPDEVVVKTITDHATDTYNIQIICRQSDRGKIIGKSGKTIVALRSLVSGAAGRVKKSRVGVEVLDEEVPAGNGTEA